jgi:hypothetical protein
VKKFQSYFFYVSANDKFRRQRQQAAGKQPPGTMNSVSRIDELARILFPASFFLLNFFYWLGYVALAEEFKWREPPPSIINAN